MLPIFSKKSLKKIFAEVLGNNEKLTNKREEVKKQKNIKQKNSKKKSAEFIQNLHLTPTKGNKNEIIMLKNKMCQIKFIDKFWLSKKFISDIRNLLYVTKPKGFNHKMFMLLNVYYLDEENFALYLKNSYHLRRRLERKMKILRRDKKNFRDISLKKNRFRAVEIYNSYMKHNLMKFDERFMVSLISNKSNFGKFNFKKARCALVYDILGKKFFSVVFKYEKKRENKYILKKFSENFYGNFLKSKREKNMSTKYEKGGFHRERKKYDLLFYHPIKEIIEREF